MCIQTKSQPFLLLHHLPNHINSSLFISDIPQNDLINLKVDMVSLLYINKQLLFDNV